MASNVADERCRERSRGQPGEGVDAVVDASNNIIAGEQSTSSTSETSKRGRGRPRKNGNSNSSAPPSSGGAAVAPRRTTRGRKASTSSEVENPALDPADGSTLLRTCQSENLPERLHCTNCQASNQMLISFRRTTSSRACMQLWESQNCNSQSDRLQHQLILQFRSLQRDAAAALEASAAAPPSSPKKKSAAKPLSPSKKGNVIQKSSRSRGGSRPTKAKKKLTMTMPPPPRPTVNAAANTTRAVASATTTATDLAPTTLRLPSRPPSNTIGNTSSSTELVSIPPTHASTEALTRRDNEVDCQGISRGRTPEILAFVGNSLKEYGQKLVEMSRQKDYMQAFQESHPTPASYPFGGMIATQIDGGFAIFSDNCTRIATTDSRTKLPRCPGCKDIQKNGRKFITRQLKPAPTEPPSANTNIKYIVNDSQVASLAISDLRSKLDAEKERSAELMAQLGMKSGRVLEGKAAESMISVFRTMSDAISKELKDGDEKLMWKVTMNNTMKYYAADGNKHRMTYDEELLEWALVLLCRTSVNTYKEVAKVMILPDVSYLYRIIGKRISRSGSRAFSLCIITISTVANRAIEEVWCDNVLLGWLTLDSCTVAIGFQWNYQQGKLEGGCNEHLFGPVQSKFHKQVEALKQLDAGEGDNDDSQNNDADKPPVTANAKCAKEHVICKFTPVKGDIKTSEIFASTNVEKCSAPVVHQMTHHVLNQIPSYGLHAAGISVDAAGPNWSAFRASSTHSASDFLPIRLMKQYPHIDFTIKHIMLTALGKPFIFCADNMHLFKAVVTCMYNSSSKYSKRYLMCGRCPISLGMVEIVYRATGGGTNQMQPTKLNDEVFFRDSRSKMNCHRNLVVLSNSVKRMLEAAIYDDTVEFRPFNNKHVFWPLVHFIGHFNELVDITNGRDRDYYTPQNGEAKQIKLLNLLEWFSKWKMNHDAAVEDEDSSKTKYNFFAAETWECIQILILSHVTVIQLYCLERGFTVNPRTLCTDTVEQHFGNSKQHHGGSRQGLTVQQMNNADTTAGVVNDSYWGLVGNNKRSRKSDGTETELITKKRKKF